MTSDKNFKRLVRARMARTGESYSAARHAMSHRTRSQHGGISEAADAVVPDYSGLRGVLRLTVRLPALLRSSSQGSRAYDLAIQEQTGMRPGTDFGSIPSLSVKQIHDAHARAVARGLAAQGGSTATAAGGLRATAVPFDSQLRLLLAIKAWPGTSRDFYRGRGPGTYKDVTNRWRADWQAESLRSRERDDS